MSYHYRCTRKGGGSGKTINCGFRFNKKHLYHDGEVKCPVCGGNAKPDPEVKRRHALEESCTCDGLWFTAKGSPHRKGSKWCIHYKGEYTEEDHLYHRSGM